MPPKVRRGLSHAFQSAAVATGVGTPLVCDGFSGVEVRVLGITTATVTFQGTVDGTNWASVYAINLDTGAAAVTTAANGRFYIPTLGLMSVRCNITAWTAGTINIKGMGFAEAQLGLGEILAIQSGTILAAGSASIGGVKDNGPHWTSSRGLAGVRFTSADASGAPASVTDAPTAGQRLVITDIIVSVDTQMRVDFKEETSGTVVASVYMLANTSQQITPRSKFKLATADKKLQVQTSVAGNIAVTAFYYSE